MRPNFKTKPHTATAAVGKAIKNGTLKRMPCQVCGNPKVEAHHDDYDKPLEVMWLCQKHHRARHVELGWGVGKPTQWPPGHVHPPVVAGCMEKYWPLITELALEKGIRPLTITKWKERHRVPYMHRFDLQDRAKAKRRSLPREAFDA